MKPLSFVVALLRMLFLCGWLAFWITLSGLAALVTLNGALPLVMARRFWAPMHWRITGSPLHVEPLPDIDWRQPHIFMMNHQSTLDIPVAFAVLPVNLRFIATHVLKWVPFLGWYMAGTGMIFINRTHRREAVKSLAKAGERIRAGASILVFPEGTRSRDGVLLPFKTGGFALALEAGVPIVPVAIEGSRQSLPTEGPLPLPRHHPIRVKVGSPIPTTGRTGAEREALLHEVREALVRLHRDIGGAGGAPQETREARRATRRERAASGSSPS